MSPDTAHSVLYDGLKLAGWRGDPDDFSTVDKDALRGNPAFMAAIWSEPGLRDEAKRQVEAKAQR